MHIREGVLIGRAPIDQRGTDVKSELNLRQYNLNALPVLREILRHGSLTKAAAALNLTQPALSNILKQLRHDFGDHLIERQGREMRLTSRGEQLIAPLEDALASVQSLLAGETFTPERATDTIRIAATDHVMGMIGGRLVTILENEAPQMRVHLALSQLSSVGALMVGDLDMIITPKLLMGAGLTDSATLAAVNVEPLMTEEMVCIGQAADAELAAGLSVEAYLARPHVGFIVDTSTYASLEQAHLAKLALQQFDRLLAPSYAILPGIVAETGSLALVPASLARWAMVHLPLQIVKPPIDMPDMELIMGWHRRNDDSPMLKWVRSALLRCVGSR
jgi:DNA-binding transcriptional LysR family regulator